jgi:hypothetical protein
MLVRTLPLLIPCNLSFEKTIKITDKKFKNAFVHQNYPLELINEKFGVRYDVMVNLVPYPQKISSANELKPRIIPSGYTAPVTKLVIDLREEYHDFSVVFTYDTYRQTTIENWAENFRRILLSQKSDDIMRPEINEIRSENTVYYPEFSEVWNKILGSQNGNFYDLGGTSLKAIQIEEDMFLRGLYISAADILRIQNFAQIAQLVTPADEIDWEAK